MGDVQKGRRRRRATQPSSRRQLHTMLPERRPHNGGSAIPTLRRCLRPTENDELVTVSISSSSSSYRFCAYKKMTKRISLYLLHTYKSMHQHINTSVTSKTTDNTTHADTTTSENTINHTIMSTETTGYTL